SRSVTIQARRTGRPIGLRIHKPFAERVQPDHAPPYLGRFVEEPRIARQRNAKARLRQIGLKPRRVRGVRRYAGEIREHILRSDPLLVACLQQLQQARVEIRLLGRSVAPEWENATTTTVVVMQVWNRGRKRDCRSACG